MKTVAAGHSPPPGASGLGLFPRVWGDFLEALRNLRAQKLRSLLTALGIVFGVGSVIGMLAIGAGARQESLRFIEQMGVRNVLVDSRPATNDQELQQRRRVSPGLTERDVRILRANIDQIELISARRALFPARVLPKPNGPNPGLLGVRPSYVAVHNLRLVEGRFLSDEDDLQTAAVCVLAQTAKVSLLGYVSAVDKYVKVNDIWLRVVGVLAEQLNDSSTGGGQSADRNNTILVPFNTSMYRFWDIARYLRDELDGVDLRLKTGADSIGVAKVVTAILQSTHRSAEDFAVTIPAALLEQQKRTQLIFTYVMVAIAAISLLVGGIGIMNIVLATVLERTREIGVRRAIGARRRDIVRQFLIESVLISVGGGLLGIALGVGLSCLIANSAGWSTIVTTGSVVVAFGVAVITGVVFGIYPAMKASEIDPIEALRYE
jgi:putative ABC transport system permease protein